MYQALRTHRQFVRNVPKRLFSTRTSVPLPEKWSKLAAEVGKIGLFIFFYLIVTSSSIRGATFNTPPTTDFWL